MLKFFFALSTLAIAINCREVCYGELGCFIDTYPFGGTWQRPIAILPDRPERIATKFTLYNKRVPLGEVISINSTLANFNPNAETKFITHGFLHNAIKVWVLGMKDSLLKVGDFNVVTVDWSKGNGFPYTQSTANTQVVGAEIARLIKYICSKKSVKEESFHLIGHSLGAHVSGYAGKKLTRLGRITGLDPAGPYFENTEPIVRLDSGDALFVDNIHTDGTATLQLGLGLMQPIGHVDFYPNGGRDQPDCPTTSGKILGAIFSLITVDVEAFEDSAACSHSAAIYYFTDSLDNKDCRFSAYKCESQKDFDKGMCLGCGANGCNRMGFYASPNYDQGQLYSTTQPFFSDSYCKQYYRVKLFSNTLGNQGEAKGKFTIYLSNGRQLSATRVIDDSNTVFKRGSVELRFFDLDKPLDYNLEITSVFVSYQRTYNILNFWMYSEFWSFSSIELLNADNQVVSQHCPTNQIIQSGSTVEFKKC